VDRAEEIEGDFRKLFVEGLGVYEPDLMRCLENGDEAALRQLEKNCELYLAIAFDVDGKFTPELAEASNAIKRHVLEYQECLRVFRRSIAKSEKRKYLGCLSRKHLEMLGVVRAVCAELCPDLLPRFEICFGA
jgi:hypothetical protein